MKRLFISYAHEDRAFRDALVVHLEVLRAAGIIASWHDGQISPGEDWKVAIERELHTADIILLLVSAHFLASQSCQQLELAPALMRWERKAALIIPILVRACDWEASPIARLQLLPSGAKPVATSPHPDDAWAEVTREIRAAATRVEGGSADRSLFAQARSSARQESSPLKSTTTAPQEDPSLGNPTGNLDRHHHSNSVARTPWRTWRRFATLAVAIVTFSYVVLLLTRLSCSTSEIQLQHLPSVNSLPSDHKYAFIYVYDASCQTCADVRVPLKGLNLPAWFVDQTTFWWIDIDDLPAPAWGTTFTTTVPVYVLVLTRNLSMLRKVALVRPNLAMYMLAAEIQPHAQSLHLETSLGTLDVDERGHIRELFHRYYDGFSLRATITDDRLSKLVIDKPDTGLVNTLRWDYSTNGRVRRTETSPGESTGEFDEEHPIPLSAIITGDVDVSTLPAEPGSATERVWRFNYFRFMRTTVQLHLSEAYEIDKW